MTRRFKVVKEGHKWRIWDNLTGELVKDVYWTKQGAEIDALILNEQDAKEPKED